MAYIKAIVVDNEHPLPALKASNKKTLVYLKFKKIKYCKTIFNKS